MRASRVAAPTYDDIPKTPQPVSLLGKLPWVHSSDERLHADGLPAMMRNIPVVPQDVA